MRRPRLVVPFLLSALLSPGLSPALLFVPAAVLAPLALTGCETEMQEGVVAPADEEVPTAPPDAR